MSVMPSPPTLRSLSSSPRRRTVVRAGDNTKLRRLSLATPSATSSIDLDIIVVPDYGSTSSPSPLQWIHEILSYTAIVAQIVIFEYASMDDSQSLWQAIGNAGVELIEALQQHKTEYGIATRPYILIGHGLGGVVLKQAMSELHQQQHCLESEAVLASMHVGHVFVGTPHLITQNVQRRSPQLRELLKASRKLSKSQVDQAMRDLQSFAAISKRYECVLDPLEITVLNVFEQRHQKLNRNLFANRQIVVDSTFVQIGLANETLVGADISRSAITNVPAGSELRRHFISLLDAAIQGAAVTPESPLHQAEPDPDTPFPHAPWSNTSGDDLLNSTPATSMPHSVTRYPDTEGLPSAHELTISPQAHLPCYALEPHSRNPDFVGRDDILQSLSKLLLPSEEEPSRVSHTKLRAIAITGLGGMGKTSIAVEFACRNQDSFDAILMVQAHNEEAIAQAFARIAHKLGLVDKIDSANHVVGRNVLLHWLAEPGIIKTSMGKAFKQVNWLLIFDNVVDPGILEDYWPLDNSGAVIITSRNPLADSNRAFLIKKIVLDPMSTEDAVSMMLRISEFEGNEKCKSQAMRLAARLNGLPLALQQISSYVRGKDLGFAEILPLLDDETIAKSIYAAGDCSGHTLATVWASQAIDPPAGDLLQVLSFLDSESVSEAILRGGPGVWPERVATFWVNELAYLEARAQLHKYSLIKRNRELDQLSVHRLVQDATRFQMDEIVCQSQFELTVRLIRHAWPHGGEFTHDPELWPRQEQIVKQVCYLQATYERHPHWQISESALSKLAEVLAKCSWYHQERGNFITAKGMLDLPLSIVTATPGSNMQLEADVYFQKAWTAAEMMDPELCLDYALKHFDTRLQLERTTEPVLTTQAAMAYPILALAYLLSEQYDRILPLLDEGLTIFENAPENDYNTFWPHFFVGTRSWALVGLGRANEAVPWLEETIEWGARRYRQTKTPCFKHAYSLRTLAFVKYSLGQYDESVELNTEAYLFYQKTIGSNTHHAADVQMKLAECKLQQSQPEQALVFANTAIKLYSFYHYCKAQLARALFIRSTIEEMLDRIEDCKASRQRATDTYREVTHQGLGKSQELTLKDFSAAVPIWAR